VAMITGLEPGDENDAGEEYGAGEEYELVPTAEEWGDEL
jgi:hypothetical protein